MSAVTSTSGTRRGRSPRDLARGAVGRARRVLVGRAALGYIAGPAVGDARTVAEGLAARGILHTLGYWDAGQAPTDVAAQLRAGVHVLGNGAAGAPTDGYLSMKAPALGFDHDVAAGVAAAAADEGVVLHLDAQDAASVDPTWKLIEGGAIAPSAVGTTLPGRWARSIADADRAVELGLARVRVVKGQFPLEGPEGTDPTLGYAGIVERLAGRARSVAVATHDPVLARHALTRLQAAGTRCELELFHGLPLEPGRTIAAELGVPVRVYVPWGHPSLPYAPAVTSPRSLGWLTRDAVLAGRRR